MSVSLVKGTTNKYDICVWPSGDPKDRIRKRIIADSRLDAVKIEKEIREALGKKNRSTYTIGNISEKYLPWVEQHQSDRTYGEKKRILYSRVLPFFRNTFPDYITPAIIEKYKTKRIAESGKVYRQINAELMVLSHMTKWGVRQGMCLDPLPRFDYLPYKRPLPKTLSRKDCLKFIEAMTPYYRALFLCMYQGGMRSGEACRLKWADIHEKRRFILIKGKGNKQRVVPMTKTLCEAFKSLERVNKWCFPSPVKPAQPVRWLRKPIERFLERAKIKKHITPHMFRHSFATHLLDSNADLKTIQDLMGHEDLSTTQIYLNVSLARGRKAIKGLE